MRLADGTDPGAISVAYNSRTLPADIVVVYAERCRAAGLAVTRQVVAANATQSRLVCKGDRASARSDDVRLIAEHIAESSITQVRISAGPSLTLTYDF